MASISCLNPRAELARSAAALEMNVSGAKGLLEVMKTNLGPKGTMKLLVSGGGDLKLTKDGNILLHEMQIRHPTASMIAKACTAQNDITGDGTTSTVLLIGEMLKQAEVYVSDGVHPRWITEGFNIAYQKTLELLEKFKKVPTINRSLLIDVARTSLRTKLEQKLADHITECVVDAVLAIRKSEDDNEPDLHMIEIMQMEHESGTDTQFVRGLVLDHGGRHPDMPKTMENVYVLICNIGMEFEKTEVNSGLFYKTAAERENLLQAERDHITNRVLKVIELKKKVCDDPSKHFVVVNQNGIDPPSLDLFAKEGIIALRRAKRRNMERLQLACGGEAVNSVEDLTPEMLGWAGTVYEHVLGEDKYTFIENCKDPKSVTLLLKGPNKHSIDQLKEAIYDGIRSVFNVLKDRAVVPGAGAFELAAHCMLKKATDGVKGRAKLGVKAFADALLIIPKVLAINSGFDAQEVIVKLIEAREETIEQQAVGLNLASGEPFCPLGIWDNVSVKKSSLSAAHNISSSLLEVDEVMRAGLTSTKAPRIGE